MKTTHLVLCGTALVLSLAGCETASPKAAKPKKEGAHVRIVNATDVPLSFILYPKQLNDQNAPGEANPFQKEPPGDRKLQILTPDKKLLQEVPVNLTSGTPTTFVVRGGPSAFQIGQIENEERFAPEGKCRVMLSSAYEGSALKVTLKGPDGEVDLGEATKIALGGEAVVPPGRYEVLIGGKSLANKDLAAGVAYSVMVRSHRGAPAATILRNSPPEMRVVGVEGASSAG